MLRWGDKLVAEGEVHYSSLEHPLHNLGHHTRQADRAVVSSVVTIALLHQWTDSGTSPIIRDASGGEGEIEEGCKRDGQKFRDFHQEVGVNFVRSWALFLV